jgi:DNA-binding NtrC family response regulator
VHALAVVADPGLRDELREHLGHKVSALRFVEPGPKADEVSPSLDLLVADLDGVGVSTLERWRDDAPATSRLLVTADRYRSADPRLTSLVPLDVLLRPLTPARIDLVLHRLREYRGLLRENRVLRGHLDRLSQDRRDASFPVGISLEEMERRLILRTLASTSGNRAQAARTLGVTPRTLSNKLKLWKIRGLLSESQF